MKHDPSLLAQPKEGWELRIKELANAKHFKVSIGVGSVLRAGLTNKENERLDIKLQLVADAAALMAAGMVKGTVKYSTENYSVDKWMTHVIDEGVDQLNYQLLLVTAYQKEVGGGKSK